jgi:hypothetical protein
MILTGFLLAGAMVLSIFLRATQQRNNTHNEWLMVWPCSQGMAWVDYPIAAFIVHTIGADLSYDLETCYYIFMLGNGAAVGCLTAMWLHNRKLRRSA